ncbi:hypothetical protein Hanom_Chr07g00585711 [Helianthus anomalus]
MMLIWSLVPNRRWLLTITRHHLSRDERHQHQLATTPNVVRVMGFDRKSNNGWF